MENQNSYGAYMGTEWVMGHYAGRVLCFGAYSAPITVGEHHEV